MNKYLTRAFVAFVMLISIAILSINALILSYLLTYGPPFIEIVKGIPDQVTQIMADIEEFKKLINLTNKKLDTINNKFR